MVWHAKWTRDERHSRLVERSCPGLTRQVSSPSSDRRTRDARRSPPTMTPEETAARWLEHVGGAPLALPLDVDRLAEEVLGLDIQEHADLRALIDPADAPPGQLSG